MARAIKRIYFDHASTTPVLPEAVRAMASYLSKDFYNPSALYKEGVAVKKALETARKDVAGILHALPDEIVFAGSGTEADNLAILGVLKASVRSGAKNPHVVISAIEHPAIMEIQDEIKAVGGSVTVVPVMENGIIDMDVFRNALKRNTVLVSVMYANNEIGAIQPIREIAKAIRFFRKSTESRKPKAGPYPYFHTDASQAGNYLDLNVLSLGVDMMTLDGSKIYGPKGVGMLFVKRGTQIRPLAHGGGQERGLRSGTENAAGIAGFAKALAIVQGDREKESKRLRKLRDGAVQKIMKLVPEALMHGDLVQRLPNNINIGVPAMDAEYAVILADTAGFAISGASSCRNLHENARSYVIEALGRPDLAESSIRITLGRSTASADVGALMKALPKIIHDASGASNGE